MTKAGLEKINQEKMNRIAHMLEGEEIKIFLTCSRSRYIAVKYCGNTAFKCDYFTKGDHGFYTHQASSETPWRYPETRAEKNAAADLVIRWIRGRA